jgi:hypothetical protein
LTNAPPITREQALLQAGSELLSEWGDPPALRETICETVTAAGEAAFLSQVRHKRSRHWRDEFAAMGLSEATARAPQDEKWSARDIAREHLRATSGEVGDDDKQSGTGV